MTYFTPETGHKGRGLVNRTVCLVFPVYLVLHADAQDRLDRPNRRDRPINPFRFSLRCLQGAIGTVKGGLLANRLGTGFQLSRFVGMMRVA